ncbi:MAG: hypothetical protein IT461_06900 [Planctomycetes bacterium]|jgi:hypothetical protein|nr:hypothetical protein [Planctomycetota bacterium]
MADSQPSDKRKPSFLARHKRGAQMFVALLMIGAGTVAAFAVKPQWWHTLKSYYGSALSDYLNAPENESVRAAMIEQLVGIYKETPAGKSLALRDEQDRVIGRFRIDKADVLRDQKQPRRFEVKLSGHGELWHEKGGRVRFEGSADVTYDIDFKLDSARLMAYSHFTCVKLANVNFNLLHVDNFLARMFTSVVETAGREAMEESIKPGFTIITRDDTESWLALGKVDKDFVPRKGPNPETDEGTDTICNDISLLQYGFRDYLGPFEMYAGDELRMSLDVRGLEGREAPGVDLLVVSEDDLKRYEALYPDKLGKDLDNLTLKPIIEYNNSKSLKFTRDDLKGRYYVIIDRTTWGRGNQVKNEAAAEVSYYGRIKRR